MYENDYIMRLIQEAARALLKLIFKIETETQEEIADQEQKIKLQRLTALVDEGKINEAENLLTVEMDANNKKDLKTAFLFYEYLNGKSNDFLEEHDFTRTEISDGIKYAAGLYGLGSMAEALLDNTIDEND